MEGEEAQRELVAQLGARTASAPAAAASARLPAVPSVIGSSTTASCFPAPLVPHPATMALGRPPVVASVVGSSATASCFPGPVVPHPAAAALGRLPAVATVACGSATASCFPGPVVPHPAAMASVFPGALADSAPSGSTLGCAPAGVPMAADQSRHEKRPADSSTQLPLPKRFRLRTKTKLPVAPSPSDLLAAGSALTPDMCEAFGLLPEDPNAKRQSYLITLPHTDAPGLVAPETLTRQEVIEKVLDSFTHPIYASAHISASGLALDKAAIGREPHSKPSKDGQIHTHDHIAILCKQVGGFRFLPVKRALMQRHQLASHWSCHQGYHSAVRYIIMPSEKKPMSVLDASPMCWAADGVHPPLFDAAQEPVTAAASRARREHKAKAASQEGKGEPRPCELDLFAIVVENRFRNTADDHHADERLIEYLRDHGGPQLYQLAWKIRHKLGALINDVWAWEEVSDTLVRVGGTRVERLCSACSFPCVCGGQWPHWAAKALTLNKINPGVFWHCVYMSLHDGRREDKRAMTLVGRRGGEGKSFLFSPLKAVFGLDGVQMKPEKGGFPLLGLQTKRVAVLDEWRFDATVLGLATQLLWFEGKPLVLSQPQNQGASGHLIYSGTAPIFITTKEQYLESLVLEAQAAEAQDGACEASMLLRRLALFNFSKKLPIPAGLKVPDCAACFAQTVVRNAAAHHEVAA